MNHPRYPWRLWFRRKHTHLRHGIDFTCMPHSMSVQVRAYARKHGYSVSVRIHPNGNLSITVTRRP